MKGKIIKGIAGFYYVHAGDALHSTDGIYECKAKGVFRKDHRKPLVGDDVEMEVIDEVANANQTRIRELIQGKNIVYIYHNQVDARGDKPASENEVFNACAEAIEEIHKLVKKLWTGY